jgi:hypothetical protein
MRNKHCLRKHLRKARINIARHKYKKDVYAEIVARGAIRKSYFLDYRFAEFNKLKEMYKKPEERNIQDE